MEINEILVVDVPSWPVKSVLNRAALLTVGVATDVCLRFLPVAKLVLNAPLVVLPSHVMVLVTLVGGVATFTTTDTSEIG